MYELTKGMEPMPIRRINFTGRQRLRAEDVEIKLYDDMIPPKCEIANLNFEGYEFPSDALVYVESYRQTSYMRFSCGTVGNLKIPDNLTLDEFDSPDAIKFRVKVTSASHPTKGQLLAELSGISDRRIESLLTVVPDSNLDHEVFRVDFTDEPILLINAKLDRWKEVATEPVFTSLVYPAALRTILTRVLCIEEHTDTEDPDDWHSRWLRFAKNNLGASDPPIETDIEVRDEWIDNTVAAFCKNNQVYHSFAKNFDDGYGQ